MSHRYLIVSDDLWKELQDGDNKHIVLDPRYPYHVGDILILEHGNEQMTRRVSAVFDQGLDGPVVLTLDTIQRPC